MKSAVRLTYEWFKHTYMDNLEATGTKYDSEKPRTDLLDPDALEGLAKVLGFGAKKYSAHNWRGGIVYSRLLGAIIRHTLAINRGENLDPESGLPHVDHLGACWMFLSNMMKTRPDLDDRWKKDKNATSVVSMASGADMPHGQYFARGK